MATTQDYINQLKIDKQNLVSMLNNMGVEANNTETFTSLTPKVGKIVTDPILQDKSVEITENGTQTIKADSGYDGLNEVEVITNVAGTGGGASKYAPRHISFRGYSGGELDEEISNLDTKNITTMYEMFNSCSNLISLNLSHFNTNNVTNISYTFSGCSKLQNINFSGFNTGNATDMRYMFNNCNALAELDLSDFNTNNVTNMRNMFSGCRTLTKLDIRNFDFTKVSTRTNIFYNVPTDCLIIVKDDTAKEWILAERGDFTNIKTVVEL